MKILDLMCLYIKHDRLSFKSIFNIANINYSFGQILRYSYDKLNCWFVYIFEISEIFRKGYLQFYFGIFLRTNNEVAMPISKMICF